MANLFGLGRNKDLSTDPANTGGERDPGPAGNSGTVQGPGIGGTGAGTRRPGDVQSEPSLMEKTRLDLEADFYKASVDKVQLYTKELERENSILKTRLESATTMSRIAVEGLRKENDVLKARVEELSNVVFSAEETSGALAQEIDDSKYRHLVAKVQDFVLHRVSFMDLHRFMRDNHG